MTYGMTGILVMLISLPGEEIEHALQAVGHVADHVELCNGVTCGSTRRYKRPFCNLAVANSVENFYTFADKEL